MNDMRHYINLVENAQQLGTIKNILIKVRDELVDNMLFNLEDELNLDMEPQAVNTIVQQIKTDHKKIEDSNYLSGLIKKFSIPTDNLQNMNYTDEFDKIGQVNIMLQQGEQSPASAVASSKYGLLDTAVRDDLIGEIQNVAKEMKRDLPGVSTQRPDTWDIDDFNRWQKDIDDFRREDPFTAKQIEKGFLDGLDDD